MLRSSERSIWASAGWRCPAWVSIFEGAGFAGAWTYINSGNVIFEAKIPRADLERQLEPALEQALGFEIATFVRTVAELRQAEVAKPFPVTPADTYFLTFLKTTLTAAQRRSLEGLSNDFDTLVVAGRTVHWRMRESRRTRHCGRRTGRASSDATRARAGT